MCFYMIRLKNIAPLIIGLHLDLGFPVINSYSVIQRSLSILYHILEQTINRFIFTWTFLKNLSSKVRYLSCRSKKRRLETLSPGALEDLARLLTSGTWD